MDFNIKIDDSKPWLKQIEQQAKEKLTKLALEQTEGNKSKASRMLGIDIKTLQRWVRLDPSLNVSNIDSKLNIDRLVYLFHLGYMPAQIAQKEALNGDLVIRRLRSYLGEVEYTKKIEENRKIKHLRRNGMHELNIDEIVENNRQIVDMLLDKLHSNKVHELGEEDLVYLNLLLNNGYITKEGKVTQEGINALYH